MPLSDSNLSPAAELPDDDFLLVEGQRFALDLMERLAAVVPTGDLGITCEAAITNSGLALIAVSSAAPGGIVLSINQEPRLQLQIDYKLVISPNSGHATVRSSSFLVRPYNAGRPLFTVDYVRDAGRNIPAAHYNFHFPHDDITSQLLNAGNARRGKHHQRTVERGSSPRLADLHFPVGGHRFRPCLEDVIEALRMEFGIDIRDTASAALRDGRRYWRRVQLRAAVSDDPEAAVAELVSKGYEVRWAGNGEEPSHREDRTGVI